VSLKLELVCRSAEWKLTECASNRKRFPIVSNDNNCRLPLQSVRNSNSANVFTRQTGFCTFFFLFTYQLSWFLESEAVKSCVISENSAILQAPKFTPKSSQSVTKVVYESFSATTSKVCYQISIQIASRQRKMKFSLDWKLLLGMFPKWNSCGAPFAGLYWNPIQSEDEKNDEAIDLMSLKLAFCGMNLIMKL
jgi:hypothetical protein